MGPLTTAVSARSDEELFVGRDLLMRQLRGALDRTHAGAGGIVCLVGEAGVGKTRAARELARLGCLRGFRVHYGGGYEGEGAPPYWPWVEILRSVLASLDRSRLKSGLGPSAAFLETLLPEFAEGTPLATQPEGDAERFQLLDAASRMLSFASAETPLLLVLDDLHWADASSLRLLEFFARDISRIPVLLVVNSRVPQAEGNHALEATLGKLARHGTFQQFALQGLDRNEICAIAESLTGIAPAPALSEYLYEKTLGNPFFVKEIVRLLAATEQIERPPRPHDSQTVPDTVRSVVRQRLARLPEGCKTQLRFAAMLGSRFDMRLLAKATGETETDVAFALAPACDAQLLVETDRSHFFRFSHPLVRDVLLLESDDANRGVMHRRIGAVLEPLAEQDPAALGALARHYLEAGAEVSTVRTIEFGRRAAAHARGVMAFEEAAELTQRLLDRVDEADHAVRGLLLYELCAAQLRGGQMQAARATALQGAQAARASEDAELLARTALQFATGQLVVGVDNEPVVALLEDALGALPDGAPLCVQLLSQLATFCLTPRNHGRAAALLQQALQLAKQLGDSEGELTCLTAELYVIWGPGKTRERIDAAARLLAFAGPRCPVGTLGFARNYQLLALLESGDMSAVDRAIREVDHAADRHRDLAARPFVLRFKAMQALNDGQLEEAEELCQKAFGLAGELGMGETAAMNMAVQMFTIRRHQGRLSELEGVLRNFVAQYPDVMGWHAALALLYVDLQRKDEARTVLLAVIDRVPELPKDVSWLTTVSALGEVCAFLSETEHASLFYELLVPFADSQAVVGNGDCTTGSVSRALGLLAEQLQRMDDAERHFNDAIRMNRRIGVRPFLAYTLQDAACFHAKRGHQERSNLLQAEAREIALSVGMPRLLDEIGEALAETAAGSSRSPANAVFREEGDHWMIGLGDRSAHLRDSRGLQQIARLLREPGREFHVLDLVGDGIVLGGQAGAVGAGQPHRSDAGPQLDASARENYRRRLFDLREEIALNEARGDLGPIESARVEIGVIEQELSRGFGLSGRERRAASAAERARVNVTRTIGRALKRIREENPSLGRALERNTRTGIFCCYEPDPDFPIQWKL